MRGQLEALVRYQSISTHHLARNLRRSAHIYRSSCVENYSRPVAKARQGMQCFDILWAWLSALSQKSIRRLSPSTEPGPCSGEKGRPSGGVLCKFVRKIASDIRNLRTEIVEGADVVILCVRSVLERTGPQNLVDSVVIDTSARKHKTRHREARPYATDFPKNGACSYAICGYRVFLARLLHFINYDE